VRAFAVLLVVLASGVASAGDGRGRADVEVVVPVAPHDPGVQWFGRHDHHAVPGTVTINEAPYRCDVEGTSFNDREAFVAHIRAVHRTPPGRIADHVVVEDGKVHFIGE
jgi:hypothetical protein